MPKPQRRPKNFAWSYSALSAYELCPKKYAAERVYKSHGEKFNPARDYGTIAHKAIEVRVATGAALPADLAGHESLIAKLDALPGHAEAEVSLVLTRDLEETVWNDWGRVWVRGRADYLKTAPGGESGFVADWKFGKRRDNFEQLDLLAAMTFTIRPALTKIKAAFYWAKDKKMVPRKYTVSDSMTIWSEFMPRVQRMEQSWEAEEFEPRPNFLCKKHCPVKECPYHGT